VLLLANMYTYTTSDDSDDDTNKLAPYGTDGRLLLTADFKVT